MDFYEVLDDVLELLRRRGRVTYRALKRQFNVDDEFLEDLKEEIIYGQKLAVDEDERVLVWAGSTDTASTPTPSPSQLEPAIPQTPEPERAPASYTPSYLAEKILTGKTNLEGERKVVTVLFADIKDSTELIRDLDPEDAQKLLDPALHIMMEAVYRPAKTIPQNDLACRDSEITTGEILAATLRSVFEVRTHQMDFPHIMQVTHGVSNAKCHSLMFGTIGQQTNGLPLVNQK